MAEMKPRPVLRLIRGTWHCNGIAGNSPADAYDRWLIVTTVPCGFVPRIHGRPS